MHSVLQPSSPEAHAISTLWWWMLAVATLVYLAVIAGMLVALRARRADRGNSTSHAGDSRSSRVPAIAAFTTLAIVAGFWMYTVAVETRINRVSRTRLGIAVTGHDWWWEITYDVGDTAAPVRTANELHIPVGERVAILLGSSDVIHSLWLPSLAGKRDLVPGHSNHIVIQADTAGVYRGQCAEFCGLQHAHMALFVIAEPRAAFEIWLRQQRQPAAAPRDTLAARGRGVFRSAQCVSCHTIADSTNPASFGPNLTHVASRSTIAAGTLANSVEHLAAWIRDPQIAKPGATMPANALAPADLRALVAYLGSLR